MEFINRPLPAFCFGLIILTTTNSLAGSEPLVRHTRYGDLEGISVESVFIDETNKTWAWLGVPYAAAPVGELRWRAPREPESWEGIKSAKSFCEPCTQYGGLMSIMDCANIGKLVGSEDCLYLNIWRPRTKDSDLPVFFWIHGGGNTVGQAAMSLYHGANFAAMTDTVFVSINYRLGPMGWFAHPALRNGDPINDSGNFGTLDIIRALEWVRDNIAAFGGDPNNVTIAGESAGGINVYSMLSSPLATGLFHRAISQSGAPFSNKMKSGEQRAEEVLLELLVNDGSAATIAEAKRFLIDKDDKWVRSYLHSKTSAEFFACYEAGTFGSAGGSNQVFVDGAVIPMSPWKALSRGKYNQVPFMAGANREEAKLFLPLVLSNLDETELCGLIKDIDPDQPDLVLSDYINPFNKAIYEPIANVSGSGFQIVGVNLPAYLMSRHQDNIFAYRFYWDEEPEPLDFVIGAGHGVEMPFMFGNFQTGPEDVLRFAWSQENRAGRRELSNRMMSYWANFARTGNPNGTGLPEWKQWSRQPRHNRMVLDTE